MGMRFSRIVSVVMLFILGNAASEKIPKEADREAIFNGRREVISFSL